MISYSNPEPCAIGLLNPDPLNPREMPDDEMEKLEHSIEKFGFLQPIVARREDHMVIGGHQRLEASRRVLRRTGMTDEAIAAYELPTIYIDKITDEQARLLNLAFNKISGAWDYDKLTDVFSSLGKMSPEDLSLSGFTTQEIGDIASLMSDPLPTAPEDDAQTIEAKLAAMARRFAFEVETDEEAKACNATLRAYGFTGPSNAGKVFATICKAAQAALEAKVPEAVPVSGAAPAPGRKKGRKHVSDHPTT